jgi:hypothetical protein
MDTVTVETSVRFKPLGVPNYAVFANPENDGGIYSIPLADLGDEAVDALVERWLDNLYAKRGQASPFRLTRTKAATP